ncbi:MAG TPA: MarR family transcriptional regulator [Clostridia bacterium]
MKEITSETQMAGTLFMQLFEKYNRIQNKKHLYKDIKELTLIEINTILVISTGELKSMSEIASTLGVSSGTPTVTIDRLIGKGYVERIRDEGDRRQVFVRLSQKGIEVHASIIEMKNRITDTIFGVLSEEEKKVLISALMKLNKKVDEVLSDNT